MLNFRALFLTFTIASQFYFSSVCHAAACRRSVEFKVSCALQSKNDFAKFDHGQFSFTKYIYVQGPGSKECKKVGNSAGESAFFGISSQGDIENLYSTQLSIESAVYNVENQVYIKASSQSGSTVVDWDRKGDPITIGKVRRLNFAFSPRVPEMLDFDVAFDDIGFAFRMKAYCVPSPDSNSIAKELNECLSSKPSMKDPHHECGHDILLKYSGDAN